jgi:diguanylate cyclase (GGDEF)-like protein
MRQELDNESLLVVIRTQAEIVTAGLDLDAVMDLVVERAQALTEAAAATAEIVDGDETVHRAVSGTAEGARDRGGSTASAPLLQIGRPVGALDVYHPEADAFGDADVTILRLLAGVIASHVAHARDFEAERHDGRHDWLTALPNRRFFDQHLGTEVARARRLGAPLTLCLFDLDGFRQVNDRLGHPAGDAVLQAAARTFGSVRAGDIAFRIGGDEFALVLPGAGEADAERVAHRVALSVSANADCLGMTVSWGVATLEEADPEQFLARADAALYAAKRARAASG